MAPDGDFRRLAGRALGVLFVISGFLAIADGLSLGSKGVSVLATMIGVGSLGIVLGAVMLRLPWHRWPVRALVGALLPAFLLVGVGNWVDPDPYLAAVFYFLLAMWLGVAQPRGTVLAASPLFALAYWLPIAVVPHASGLGHSVPYVTAVCVLAGESLSWLTARLHTVQRRLREHGERRSQALLAGSSDTTIVFGSGGDISYVSPSAERVLRLPAGDVGGGPVSDFVARYVHPEDASHLTVTLARLIGTPDAEESVQFRVARPDGTWRDVEGLGRNLLGDDAVNGVLLNLRDVSDRRQLERELTHQAFSDQLTGLPNRTLLHDRAAQAVRSAGRHGHLAALLLIDLDRFKEVNDTLGHHHGDLLLQQVAERLRSGLRDSDTVARLGGDEFAILLPQIAGIEDAAAVAAKLREAIEVPFTIDGLTLEVDASIGLAAYPDHADSADELLQRADVAMYAAKAAHLDYVVYEPSLDRHSPRRLGLLGQLRRAIASGELVVFYQPKADASSGRVLGVEALVRWQHPEYGLIGPDEFVPLAETTGLIRTLTSHVLTVGLRDCRAWLAAGRDLSVAVNVSARCLLDINLPDEISQRLDEYGIPASRLVLEITESAIMTDPARALEILNRLHALGVRLSIDDFGTGYSSMAYLKNLPVHELKVDRSFVTNMRTRQSELVIVRSTVDLGHNLGLKVVAEGVEDAATWRDLDGLGCDTVQGYYLAKPMPASQLTTWLATHPEAAALRSG